MNGSYEISPLPLVNFIESRFDYPRFQRKSVWKDDQNFELMLSIFKGYPLGVVIVSSDDSLGAKKSYLLDGRQRKTCLTLARKNPEYIYKWAAKYCALKTTDSEHDVRVMFWRKVDEFFYQDSITDESPKSTDELLADDEENENSNTRSELSQSIGTLLEIILGIHPLRRNRSGLSEPWLLTRSLSDAPSRISELRTKGTTKERVLSGQKCTELYRSLDNWLKNNDRDVDINAVWEWISEQNMFSNPIEAHTELGRNWDSFKNSILRIQSLDNLLSNSKIGLVDAKNYSDTDRQMIFQYINDGGTPLTGIQILSASPYWNKTVDDGNKLQQSREALYSALELNCPPDVVRWDCAATLPSSLNLGLLLSVPEIDAGNLDVRLKIGFKVYSLDRSNAVGKPDIQALGTDDQYWRSPLKILDRYNPVLQALYRTPYFSCMKSWDGTLEKLTSQNASLFFLQAITQRYEEHNCPLNGGKYYQWLNEAFALLDRLILEGIQNKWKGSSDSMLARKLSSINWRTTNWDLEAVETWTGIINELNSSGTIGGNKSDRKTSEKIVRHLTYCNDIYGDGTSGELDHIIPASRLIDEAHSAIKDSPANLVMVSKELNRIKGDKFPGNLLLHDQHLLARFTKLDQEDIINMKGTNSLENLKNFRAKFYEDFKSNRQSKYRNQG